MDQLLSRPRPRPLPGRGGAAAGAGMVLPLSLGREPVPPVWPAGHAGPVRFPRRGPRRGGAVRRCGRTGEKTTRRSWPPPAPDGASSRDRPSARGDCARTDTARGGPAATPPSSAAAAYLSGVGRVEDWGCGTAYFKRFVPAGCYWGIDHDPSAAATRPPTWPAIPRQRTASSCGTCSSTTCAGEASCTTPWRRSAAAWSWWCTHPSSGPPRSTTACEGPAGSAAAPRSTFAAGTLCASSAVSLSGSKRISRPTLRSAGSTSSTFARTDRHEIDPR